MIFTTPPVVTPVSQEMALVFKFNFDADAPKIFCPHAGLSFVSVSPDHGDHQDDRLDDDDDDGKR
jgi:hypothetical protein